MLTSSSGIAAFSAATGTAATFYALVGAIRSMRAGNQKQMQLFFRLRVAYVLASRRSYVPPPR
jgi:hypothetical protein